MKIHKSLSLFVSMNKVVNKDGSTCTNECIFIDHLGESADRGWSMGKSTNFSHMGESDHANNNDKSFTRMV